MGLTVNSQGVADMQVQTVQLRSLLGSYELSFLFSGTTYPMQQDEVSRWLVVHGARVVLKAKGGPSDLPLALPDQPAIIRQGQYANPTSFELRIPLQPHQLEALETARDGGDLHFEMRLSARGGDSQRGANDWPEQASLTAHVPESNWVAQLASAKALRILLLEISMPFSNGAGRSADKHLTRAQKHFIEGNYRECVSECRQFAEEVGQGRTSDALTKLKQDRMGMTKYERQVAILATLQNYAHLAAHSGSAGGVNFNRDDAKLALSLAAALAAHPDT